MDEVNICIPCLLAYASEEAEKLGVRKLKSFKGYTVDLRLQEFRKTISGKKLEFVPFNSPKGEKLLAQMHEKVTK